jgi:glycosyltransferase involved in cell wall biosynthesis
MSSPIGRSTRRTGKLRVLSVVPGFATGLAPGFRMIFARNQIEFLEQLGVTNRSFFLRSRTSPAVLLQEARSFRQAVAEFDPDLVHAHYGTVTALFCALLTRKPLVITFQGGDLNPYWHPNRLRPPAGRVLSQLAALRARRIICVSSELRDRLWWRHSKTCILPSGVDVTLFRPMARREARAALGWSGEESVVVSSAGTDPPRKRLDLARSAVDVAESLCGKIRFLVLDGHMEQREIALVFNAADALVFTSDTEGSPNIVKEALACNLPVVSVDVGDVKERLRGVQPAAIVGRDPREIGKALAAIVVQRERSNGVQMIQDLSAEHIALKVLQVYEEALAR